MANMLLDAVINYTALRPDSDGHGAVNLNEVVTSITDEILHKEPENPCRFIIQKELPLIQGLSSSLGYQLFENLMENIAIHCEADGPDISISWADNGREYVFSMSINRVENKAVSYNYLFDLLPKHDNALMPCSKKLGLMLSQKIAEHYGGSIWVHSETGAASTLYFSLNKAIMKGYKNGQFFMAKQVLPGTDVQRNIA